MKAELNLFHSQNEDGAAPRQIGGRQFGGVEMRYLLGNREAQTKP